ncbi:hypothetical protein J3L16_06750 [Alteromonas sp. 5E99-2]|uniref:hypothetical protein n=1 Tax=Alteromonas sp. 5E99-2 TaxID=2817683 RepID=UPI001A986EBC|nr:hypothetical protein [Alteromonas sp. 5E99-2]MBO1255381.1 hypothetical protein [Alteromonas sp. 5E99-2]
MKPLFPFIILLLSLSACRATQAPPYQADREPENRDTYNGIKGLSQYQKDQVYLMEKELSEECEEAKIELGIAETKQDESSIKTQKKIISRSCVSA